MENENVKAKKGKKTVVILIAVIGTLLIAGGSILLILGNPKRITSIVINKLSTNLENTIKKNKDITGLTDNYSAVSNIKFNLQSDYFKALSEMNPEYATITNLFTNLTNTDTSVVFVQDKENQKLFLNWDSKLGNQELINAKYLIENNTQYYHINGVENNYINNGNNNYFESLTSSTTTNENLAYIIKTTMNLVGENLKDEYFTESSEDEYRKITVTLNKSNYIELANNVLAGLKQDEKATKILTGYNQDFEKSKITGTNIKSTDCIEINIYTDKFLSQPKKYEVKIISDETISYTYYKEKETGIIEMRTDNKLTGKMEIKTNNEKTEMNIMDEKGTQVGTISITSTDTNKDILVNIKNETTEIEVSYNSKTSNIKKNESYDNDTTLSLKIANTNVNLVNGTITAKTKVTKQTTINEDISTSVLASTITPQQQELLNQKIMTVIMSLMS